ncbi:MAG: virulence RhuM family protein [Saprospiraceae bacterium]|nr:virulence RhuM family protein [Saprospiraceae bacterium]
MENQSEILLYQTEDGQTKIEVRLNEETVWLSLNQLVELFQRDKSVISRHISNIFGEGELDKNSVVANYATTASDGKTYQVDYYNLDVIISVGYRVKSHRGTQFRIWATQRLKEYIVKGFTLDDERLKRAGQMNYFDELLNRIRDIRSSERVFYQKVKDIYTTSIDYDANAPATQQFFKIVQNKLIFAVSQQTAAEVIANRADASKPNMGLTTWDNAPKGKIRKTDVTVSKNYLSEDEIQALNLLVEQFLAFAEAQAQQRKPMYMQDWITRLNAILAINERAILQDAGRITKQLADEKAGSEYEKYKEQQSLLEKEQSIDELEKDLKKLKDSKKK